MNALTVRPSAAASWRRNSYWSAESSMVKRLVVMPSSCAYVHTTIRPPAGIASRPFASGGSGQAAVGADDLARDVTGAVRAEERDHGGDLVGLTGPTER